MTPNPKVIWILTSSSWKRKQKVTSFRGGGRGEAQNQYRARPPKASHSSLALHLHYRSRTKLAWCPVKGGVLSAIGTGPRLETGPLGQAAATMGPCREYPHPIEHLVLFIGLKHQEVALRGTEAGHLGLDLIAIFDSFLLQSSRIPLPPTHTYLSLSGPPIPPGSKP